MAMPAPKPAAQSGILPAQAIRALAESGVIAAEPAIIPQQIQPASLDLRLGRTAHRLRASFLPGSGSAVADKLSSLVLHSMDLTAGAVLEVGCVYLVPLLEHLALPATLAAATNPKSSTGRLDVFTRVITDGARGFDTIAPGYHGPLYAEICPQTFPIVVRTGSRLSQLRFRQGQPTEADDATAALHRTEALISTADADIAGGVGLSVDLAGETGAAIGYRAKRHTSVIDVDRAGAYPVAEFWEPILASGERRLILDPDQFYILASKEAVHVPPSHAAEMVPFNPLVGEFRVHYAGFFDPGFGHAASGGGGSRAVLEVRSHTVPFILEDGQIIGRLIYERMLEPPEAIYGAGIGSHYQAQGLKLSKHFC